MEEFSDGGSTPPASTKKERHDVSRVFLFWAPPPLCGGPGFRRPQGGSTLSIFASNYQMLSSVA